MELFKYLGFIISSPKYGWEQLGKLSIPTHVVQARLFYPLLAVLAVSAFAGRFDSSTLTQVIQNAIIQFSAFFFTYLAASFILDSFFKSFDSSRLNIYLAYNLSFLTIISCLGNLIGGFGLIFLVKFYVIYLIVSGMEYLKVDSSKRMSFGSMAVAILLLLPYCIETLLHTILPNN